CVERTPDIYLYELQYHLRESRGVEVSIHTIERTLHRHGFSHKKVRVHNHMC
ncbi:hypothetical protein SCLCIDRAFT_117039, partial [Scleroderma citrinum Foug A]